jgi:hypothetical protein
MPSGTVVTAEVASPMRPPAASQPWIISRREDLLWFQGSVVAGLALLAFFLAAPRLDAATLAPGHPVVLAVFLWGVLFDGTHVWGTYARSYLAPDETSRASLPGRRSWLLLAVGPVIAFADATLSAPGSLFGIFLLAAYLWAYWHLVRQHYGFVMLYRKRAGEYAARGASLDSLVLWIGCLYPFLRFSLGAAYLRTGLPQLLPASWLGPLRLALDLGFAATMIGIVGLIASERVEPLRLGPKHLLLAIVVSFHVAVFGFLDHLLPILATLTIFHNLQYHRIVWQYERGLGRRPSGGLGRYLAAGVALGIVWYTPRVLGAAAAHDGLACNLLLGLGWGVAFHHYLVDGRIWRVRRSASVSRALDGGAAAR